MILHLQSTHKVVTAVIDRSFSSMVTSTNNGGGSKNLLPPSLHDGGRPYRHTYIYSENSSPSPSDDRAPATAAIVLAVAGVLLMLYRVCTKVRTEHTEEPPLEPRAGGARGNAVRQLELSEAGGDWVDGAPAPSTAAGGAAVEVAAPVRPGEPEPPLVCTYRKADGWREGTCGVCLAELDDGEVVRVLPACMHYFHAGCVGEWLRVHATCPLCRAPLVAPADDVS